MLRLDSVHAYAHQGCGWARHIKRDNFTHKQRVEAWYYHAQHVDVRPAQTLRKYDFWAPDRNQTRNLLITGETLKPLSCLRFKWWAKVHVRHMCCLRGSHDMLIILLNATNILHVRASRYVCSAVNINQALTSENDFWSPDGDWTRNLLMTGETFQPLSYRDSDGE